MSDLPPRKTVIPFGANEGYDEHDELFATDNNAECLCAMLVPKTRCWNLLSQVHPLWSVIGHTWRVSTEIGRYRS